MRRTVERRADHGRLRLGQPAYQPHTPLAGAVDPGELGPSGAGVLAQQPARALPRGDDGAEAQRPHGAESAQKTSSPGDHRVTPGPHVSTTPANSCPRRAG